MATKRKMLDDEDDVLGQEAYNKKHTLDSDEEDSDDYEKEDLKDSDIEGGEEGESTEQDEVKITPFNMREELQEGHFDKDGHYHWNKDSEIRDNWLDNIDWVKLKNDKNNLKTDANEDDAKAVETFNEAQVYGEVLKFMEAGETVQKTLQRLGKGRKKISTAERLRQKKLGIVDEAAERITKFTELTNEILTRTGNMDIYQETYGQIKRKLQNIPSTSKGAQSAKVSNDDFDMYADDFLEKEKSHLKSAEQEKEEEGEAEKTELLWEFKWTQEEDAKLNGPYNTQQMLKWAQEKYFKDGVYVRKVGQEKNFYSSNRIDFDLYL